MIQVYNPFSLRTDAGTQVRDPFPGNIVPKNLFDPLALKALTTFQESGVLNPNNGAAPGETLSKFSFLTFTVPANFNSDFVFVAVSSAQNKNYNALTGGGDSGGSSSGQYTWTITPFTPPSGWIGGFVWNDRNRNRPRLPCGAEHQTEDRQDPRDPSHRSPPSGACARPSHFA